AHARPHACARTVRRSRPGRTAPARIALAGHGRTVRHARRSARVVDTCSPLPPLLLTMDTSLDHLEARFRVKVFELLARAVEARVPVIVTNTLRTAAEQADLVKR